ncbi:MAG: HxsD-like protein [Myxococcota bacterium]
MSTLRFHKALYAGEAVDAALKRLQRFGRFETREDAEHWVVEVEATRADLQRRLEGELCNFALGLTVERGGPSEPSGSEGG